MVPALRGYFEDLGYHVLEDPGGGSFFDVVVIKVEPEEPKLEPEVGFVGLKLASTPRTAAQALHRLRTFTGDWAAICHPSRQGLERLMSEHQDGVQGAGALDNVDKNHNGNIGEKENIFTSDHNLQGFSNANISNLGCLWFHGGQITQLRPWTLRPPPRPGYQGPWPLLWEERSIAYRRLVQMAVVELKGLDPEAFWGHGRGCTRTALLHDVEYINDRPAPPLDRFDVQRPGSREADADAKRAKGRGSALLPAGQRSLAAYGQRVEGKVKSKD